MSTDIINYLDVRYFPRVSERAALFYLASYQALEYRHHGDSGFAPEYRNVPRFQDAHRRASSEILLTWRLTAVVLLVYSEVFGEMGYFSLLNWRLLRINSVFHNIFSHESILVSTIDTSSKFQYYLITTYY